MQATEVRETLKRLGMTASKGLGQHFLIDERVARRQVERASIKGHETVLEVGPGLGTLTRYLVGKARRVIAIEKDRRLCRYLEVEFPQAILVEGDALKVDLPRFDLVVSNLPYQISSPLTFRLLGTDFDRAVLMYQSEFAKRMVAGRGDPEYSRLSVQVYYRCETEIVENVHPSAFYPRPKVRSSIVALRPRAPPFDVADEGIFRHLVDGIFRHRRKTLENSVPLEWPRFTLDRATVRGIVASAGFSGKRAEELTPEEMGALSDAVASSRS